MLLKRTVITVLVFLISFVNFTKIRAEEPIKISQIVVTPSQYSVSDDTHASMASMNSQQLEELPQIGDDLYRTLARLPGLQTDDFTAKFSIRGAPFNENKSLLDGVELTEPFHLKDIDGALSIVDPEIISSLQLFTGGFGVEVGGKLSGLIEMETKSFSQPVDRLSLSLTGLGAMTSHGFNSGKSSILVSARRGYPDIAMHLANRYQDVTPRYYDLFAKYLYHINSQNSVSLEYLHAGDTLTYNHTNDPSLKSVYSSDYVWSRWEDRLSDSLDVKTVLSLDRLRNSRLGSGSLDGYPFSLQDNRCLSEFKINQSWHLDVAKAIALEMGFDAQKQNANYAYYLTRQQSQLVSGKITAVTIKQTTLTKPSGDEYGEFIKLRLSPIEDLVLDIGLRDDNANLSRGNAFNPRISVSYHLLGGVVRATWGRYSQVEELNELAVFKGETQFSKQQLAEQRIISYEYPLSKSIQLRLEGYDRVETRLKPSWENVNNGYQLFPEVQNDFLLLSPTQAESKGLEVLLRNKLSGKCIWNFNYALAQSNQTINGNVIPRQRDQRNTISTDLTYSFNPQWQLSADWQYHTGWPTTNVVYAFVPMTNGQQYLSAQNGPLYNLRLPAYHRLDFRLTHRIATSHGTWRMYLDIFNAYNHYNLIGYDHTVTTSSGVIVNTLKPRDQLPLLPSAGLVCDF